METYQKAKSPWSPLPIMSPRQSSTNIGKEGKYTLFEELGHGGMATVYRGYDSRLHREVAVKILHPHLRESLEIGQRFLVEARAVAKLKHANILEVYDVADENEVEKFLVVELVKGKTLRQILCDHSPLPAEVAAALGVELLHAMEHAHKLGVVHRDIKPENVMIEFRDSTASVKLMDFGIAKLIDSPGVTSTGEVLGSPAHMSPEQIEGAPVDERADLFALGVLLYECLVGHLPFFGSSPAQVLRKVLSGDFIPAERKSPSVGKTYSFILDQALATHPSERYQHAKEFRVALESELTRLKAGKSHEILNSYFSNPTEFEKKNLAHLIDVLCTNAELAQANGDILLASQDYSRALALAPTNKALLRKASKTQALKRQSQLIRQVGRALGALCLLGAMVYVAYWLSKPRPAVHHAESSSAPSSLSATGLAPVTLGSPIAANRGESTSNQDVQIQARSKNIAPEASTLSDAQNYHERRRQLIPHKNPMRDLIFFRVSPPAGVRVSVDGAPLTTVANGTKLSLDHHAHDLRFSCVADMCEPQSRMFAEGLTDQTWIVELQIKPGRLIIEGDSLKHYGVEERPELSLRAGLPQLITLKRGSESVVVIELETGIRHPVIIQAGQSARVTFP